MNQIYYQNLVRGSQVGESAVRKFAVCVVGWYAVYVRDTWGSPFDISRFLYFGGSRFVVHWIGSIWRTRYRALITMKHRAKISNAL